HLARRQLRGERVAMGDAVGGERAGLAAGARAHADSGAQVHDRLGVVRHALLRRMRFGVPPQLLLDRARGGIAVDAVVAGQHALDVAIEDGESQAVRLGQDGAGGGAADAGQRIQRGEVARQFAAMLRHADPRGLMQEACAAVVAQPRPQRQHGVLVSRREIAQGRQCGHEALEVADHGGDLGLLQHHLGQPYAVGVAPARRGFALPGQVLAAMPVEPAQQPAGQAGDHGCLLMPAYLLGAGLAGAALAAAAGTSLPACTVSPSMCTLSASMLSNSAWPLPGGIVSCGACGLPSWLHQWASASGGRRRSAWLPGPSSFSASSNGLSWLAGLSTSEMSYWPPSACSSLPARLAVASAAPCQCARPLSTRVTLPACASCRLMPSSCRVLPSMCGVADSRNCQGSPAAVAVTLSGNGWPETRRPARSERLSSSTSLPRTTLPWLMSMPVSMRGILDGAFSACAGSAAIQSCNASRSTRGESICSCEITVGPPNRVCQGSARRPRAASRIGAPAPSALSVMPCRSSAGRGNRLGLAGLARRRSRPAARAWVCNMAVKRSGCSTR